MAPVRLVVFGLLLLTLLPSPVTAQSVAINDTFFLLANEAGMTVVNVQGEVQHKFSNPNSYQVDFDPTTARIFWPDRINQSINRAFLNGSERTVLHQLPSGSLPEGVAVDHIRQLVFYSDYVKNLIGVVDTDGGSQRIVRTGLTAPYALAVDVIHEFLYHIEYWSRGRIGRMDYNGSSYQILYSDVYYSRGLALDVRGGRMYWSTFLDGRLESARLNGTDRTLVWQGQVNHLGLAFSDGVLYFTVQNVSSIFSVNVNGTDLQQLPVNVSGFYRDIAVYSKSRAITLEEKRAALGLTETPSTATPRIEETTSTATTGMDETPSTATPGMEETTSTATTGMDETPSTATPRMEETTSTATTGMDETPSTATPRMEETTSTATTGMDETPSTATPRMEETTSTATPRIEGTPSTTKPVNKEFVVTPSVFLILTGMFVNFLC